MCSLQLTNHALLSIQQGRTVRLYVTGNFASLRHVDYICQCGEFDAIWFDLEHFDIPVQDLAGMVMVMRAYPMTAIARFKATDYQVVMRVLETGVGGIMCSMVNSSEEACQIVSWAKFHNPTPADGEVTGMRGWNGGNVDGRYGTVPARDYVSHQNRQTMIICQVETEEAVRQAGEIAAVPGVDGLFFGPGDFALGIGMVGQITHPRVFEAASAVARAAQAAGKWWGTVAPHPEFYRHVMSINPRLVSVGGDNRVMALGVRELVKSFGPRGLSASLSGSANPLASMPEAGS